MALDITRLKDKIKAAFTEQDEESDYDAAAERVALKIATAVVEEIKFAKVNYTSGLVAGANPVTGTLTHTIT